MPTIIATPAASNANSFETLIEAEAYFATRLSLAGWDDADDKNVLLIMSTRILNAFGRPFKKLMHNKDGDAYYYTRRQWTGVPATTTQSLSWPRIGMLDANGNAIASTAIPQELKDAESELAGQLGETDRTLDNEIIVQGITSIKASSVALTFKEMIQAQVVPDAVWNLMPPSWFTDEIYEPAVMARFEVIS